MSIKVKKTQSGFEFKKTDKKPSNPNGWKERYDISCPHCSDKFDCAPSIFHMMGAHELGGGSCPSCKGMMEIHFNPENDTMTTHKVKKETI
ncbi:hypothetical protein [Psychrobacter arcticus]|uniref:hypothetical protein n=1 Tax=Psychrobacter arcticus TaxID=334543 RepID=UPI0000399C45|nr:hypothetical protein [Psychrobacter arcticus]